MFAAAVLTFAGPIGLVVGVKGALSPGDMIHRAVGVP